MGDIFKIIGDLGFPIAAALAGGRRIGWFNNSF